MTTDIPQEMSIFEIFFDITVNSWQSWRAVFMFSQEQKQRSKDMNRDALSIMVKTQDFCRIEFLMQRLIHSKHPVLLIGPTSTGKTTFLRYYLRTQDNMNKMTHLELISCSNVATAKKT